MVDHIDKALAKLSMKKRKVLQEVLLQLRQGDTQRLDIKKLKGRTDIYRVRKGNMRIIFQRINERIIVLAVEKRNDHTY